MYPTVFHGSAAYVPSEPGPVVSIGNFDGVHLGHRALIQAATDKARALGTQVCAFTFHPAPRDVLRPGNPIPRIQILEDRLRHLGEAGAAEVVVEPFTSEYGQRSAEWFAAEVLKNRLKASAVVVGWDFRFGQGRSGDAGVLRRALDVQILPFGPFEMEGIAVSSSRIRMAVRSNDLSSATALLGRHHEVLGQVVAGHQRGRAIGFPTANVAPRTALLPTEGVYAVMVDIGDGVRRPAVANLGKRPTFNADETALLEVHILDFDGDLYQRAIRVFLVARLRSEKRFASSDDLVEQIRKDIQAARELLQ